MERFILTAEQAINLLPDGEDIHTFRNPGGMLIGCDISRGKIISELRSADEIELGGETSIKMNHAIIIYTGGQPLFIENDTEKIKEFL